MTVKLLGMSALLAACTHHAPLAQATADITERDWVTIDTTTMGTVEAYAIPTASGISFQLGNGTYIDAGNVIRVHGERTLRGAGEGFLIGAGIGVAGGALIGLIDGDDPPCMGDHQWLCYSLTGGEKAVLFGVLFGGLGGIVGLAVGAIRGSQFIYEGSGDVAITPVGPAGSVAGLTITY